jgi:cell division protein DivIC
LITVKRYRFYLITALALLVWMAFFDPNDFRSQFYNWQRLRELEQERAFYVDKIKEVERQQREVLGTDQLREKFARERYLMKKATEDVFVLVDENGEPFEK